MSAISQVNGLDLEYHIVAVPYSLETNQANINRSTSAKVKRTFSEAFLEHEVYSIEPKIRRTS